jgi:hypothetical protein
MEPEGEKQQKGRDHPGSDVVAEGLIGHDEGEASRGARLSGIFMEASIAPRQSPRCGGGPVARYFSIARPKEYERLSRIAAASERVYPHRGNAAR